MLATPRFCFYVRNNQLSPHPEITGASDRCRSGLQARNMREITGRRRSVRPRTAQETRCRRAACGASSANLESALRGPGRAAKVRAPAQPQPEREGRRTEVEDGEAEEKLGKTEGDCVARLGGGKSRRTRSAPLALRHPAKGKRGCIGEMQNFGKL